MPHWWWWWWALPIMNLMLPIAMTAAFIQWELGYPQTCKQTDFGEIIYIMLPSVKLFDEASEASAIITTTAVISFVYSTGATAGVNANWLWFTDFYLIGCSQTRNAI